MNDEKLELTREWDKALPHSDEVNHEEATFHNRYGITLAADLYRPKGARDPLVAITVSGPFSAARGQPSDLYAQAMAERGFLTLVFDPSYAGESGGAPRYMVSPDINTEDFSATVDHPNCREDVDPERIGIIGTCGWSGVAVSAVAPDPRIRVTVAPTIYGMSRITAKGCSDEQDSAAARGSACVWFAAQRTANYRSRPYARAGGVVDSLPEDVPAFVRDCHSYYKTLRGYHLCSFNSNGGWDVVGTASSLSQPLFTYAGKIRTPVLAAHSRKAHSCYMGEGAFAQLIGENKELFIVSGVSHADLYDGGGRDAIPFDRITRSFRASLA